MSGSASSRFHERESNNVKVVSKDPLQSGDQWKKKDEKTSLNIQWRKLGREQG